MGLPSQCWEHLGGQKWAGRGQAAPPPENQRAAILWARIQKGAKSPGRRLRGFIGHVQVWDPGVNRTVAALTEERDCEVCTGWDKCAQQQKQGQVRRAGS